jgi:hypothetical protein
LHGIDNTDHEGSGDDPIVCVIHTDGPRVLDQMGSFLWDENQASAVEVADVGFRGSEGGSDAKQKRAGDVGELLVGLEGDAVGAAGGVWGRVDGVEDGGEAEGLDEGGVDKVWVVGNVFVDEGGVVIRGVVPDGGEIIFNEGAERGGVLGRGGGGVCLEGDDS